MKRQYRDSKYGFGGKKRGLKANTRDSSAFIDDKKPSFKNNKLTKPGKKNSKVMRPGKNKRVKAKAKKSR